MNTWIPVVLNWVVCSRVITPWSKGRNWSGKDVEREKGEEGALVNTNTLWTGRVRGACRQCSRIQEGRSQAKGLWY